MEEDRRNEKESYRCRKAQKQEYGEADNEGRAGQSRALETARASLAHSHDARSTKQGTWKNPKCHHNAQVGRGQADYERLGTRKR